ncbi:MAG: hypothetical protein E7473_05435 [Ruminococcaceae bacterium]|nr:hypothetical protein [Oscillospiraceae bacterium]
MKKIEFFDCEASFGLRGFKRENMPTTKEEMLSKFDRYGIDYALMRYEFANNGFIKDGDLELCDVIKDDERLFPMWYVMPHYTGEFPAPEELVALMKEKNVKACAIQGASWTVGEFSCGELFDVLGKHKIPLLVPISRIPNGYNGLYEILKNHGDLRVILTGVGYTSLRDLYPLLSMFPNLYISTSTYKAYEGVEDTVERFGAERLIFGSGMPDLSGAASVALITYARISDEDKQKIASGNLKKLLSEVEF